MRKFYLLGNTNVFRGLVLMAVAAGSYTSLQAQTCTNATAGTCTGGNVTENFNSNGGTFTSSSFTYNAGAGNYQVNPASKNTSYTITSGTYVMQSTGGNFGFSVAGSASNISSVQVRILNASTNATITSCSQNAGSFAAANQVCVQLGGLIAGTQVKFQFVITTANGAGGDGTVVFDNFASAASAAALPVKLDNFEAAKDGSGVKLSWRASEESGVVRYEVQRSTDGVNFQTIGNVTAEAKKSYSYLDVLPTANGFYRLRIVDADNTSKISHIVSIKSKLSAGIEAYPNPVRDRMIVQHPKAVTGTRIQMVNLTGQVVRDVQVPANAVVTPLDVTGLSNGTYYIVFRSGSESFSQRVTKQ